jgi:catechol 2,3-dioxygenase-like lactoylglutathione lyase family enzyme
VTAIIDSIGHIAIRTRDLDAAVHHAVQVMGMRETRGRSSPAAGMRTTRGGGRAGPSGDPTGSAITASSPISAMYEARTLLTRSGVADAGGHPAWAPWGR